MKGQTTEVLFNSDTAGFGEIEQKIVSLLTEDLRSVRGSGKDRLEQNAQQVLSLAEVMKDRFRTRCSVEYLFYLVRQYSDRGYSDTKKVISRFLNILNLRIDDLQRQNLYKVYRKMIKHRIQDKQHDTTDDNIMFADEGVSFIKSYGLKTIHLI